MKEAVIPSVGLCFLPGANLPEVNRLEQYDMVDQAPHQLDATWRVNTTGALLTITHIGKELAVNTQDITADVARSAHRRLEGRSRRSRNRRNEDEFPYDDAVTIDSENVKLLRKHDSQRSEFDLCATLVEVDMGSLWALICDYRYGVLACEVFTLA